MSTPTPDLAELRRLAEAATPGPWETAARQLVIDSARRLDIGMCGHRDDAAFIAAANPAVVLALLDAAAFLDEVREQVARGALCPMCSTGMTRQTVGMVCQLCGTDYARPEYASLRRDSEQTTKAALAEALAVRAERDALAAKVERVRALVATVTGHVRTA